MAGIRAWDVASWVIHITVRKEKWWSVVIRDGDRQVMEVEGDGGGQGWRGTVMEGNSDGGGQGWGRQ